MRLLAAAAFWVLWGAAPPPARAGFATVYDGAGARLGDEALFAAFMGRLAGVALLPPFPHDATALAASYAGLDRSVYAAYEGFTLHENLKLAAGGDPGRLGDAAAWGLWLVSREAVNFDLTMGAEGPWSARRFRGWGKRDFANPSGGFAGWHTFAEQTSVPLIGLLQAARALRARIARSPAAATAPVFAPGAAAALRAAGALRLLPPGLRSEPEIEACRAAPACRWDATGATLGEAAAAFEAFAGAVLGWWVEHAATREGDTVYFWYTADGAAEFAGTGVAARDWFVAHANMLMGRAAYLYGAAAGDASFTRLAGALQGQFESVHYPCRAGRAAAACYHYAVKANEWRAWREAAWDRLSPAVVRMSPPRSLEEPFHRNASHALTGLLAGGSLLSGASPPAPAAHLAASQRTYLAAYAAPRPVGACPFLLPAQCALAPVHGPPGVRERGGEWVVEAAEEFVPEEALVEAGASVLIPDYRSAHAVAGFYLAEGASGALFERLVLWWDAFGRRHARDEAGAPCRAGAPCPTPDTSANFRKMTVFLAAEAYRRMHAAPAAPPPRREPEGGCASGGGSGAWVLAGWLGLTARRATRSTPPRAATSGPVRRGARARRARRT